MTQIILADDADVLPEDEFEIEFTAEEPFYSGEEYRLHCAYYLGDDEVLDADVFDEVAYANWREEIDIEE